MDRTRLFAFGPSTREVIRERDFGPELGPSVSHQGTRAFVPAPDGAIYVLLNKGIARLNTEDHKLELLVEAPVTIGGGGAWLDGRIYFFKGLVCV